MPCRLQQGGVSELFRILSSLGPESGHGEVEAEARDRMIDGQRRGGPSLVHASNATVSDADEAGAGGQRSSGTVHGVDEGRSRTGDVGMQDAEGGDEEAEGLGDGTDAVTDAAIQSAMQTAREAGIDFDDLVDADL